MKQISTAKLGGRKKVEIDGHAFSVRKMGAGESLALSQSQRRIEVLAKKEEAGTITEAEKDEFLKLGSSFIDAMASLYDDGVGGKKAQELIRSLSPEELAEMNKQIWEVDAAESTPVNA